VDHVPTVRGALLIIASTLLLAACATGPRGPFAPDAAGTPTPRLDANASLLVTSKAGRPIAGALVMLHGPPDQILSAIPPRAVLEFVDDRLLPRTLAVPVGTAVAFRNSSELAHEIYTFSKARPFAARLAPKAPPAHIVFERAGLVVLGCKLHGDTIAYLHVTDAVRSGVTDADGYLRVVGLLPGDYRAEVWRAPTARDQTPLAAEQKFALAPGGSRLVRIAVR
jgi:hypothetical protein